jgi:hypothetical protein
MTNDFKVTRALPGDSLSAQIKAAGGAVAGDIVAVRGQMVQIDPATAAGQPGVFDSDVAWKLANTTRGFHLERDVIVGAIPFEQIAFNKDFTHPDSVNEATLVGYASARKVQEFEIEGPDLIDVSLDGTTAAGTAITSKAGKVSLKGSSDELYGYLRAQLAKKDSTNTCRLLIEVVE